MHERLSPVEAIMWRAGQDPSLRMIVGNLIILDRGPSPEALQARPGPGGRAGSPTAVPS